MSNLQQQSIIAETLDISKWSDLLLALYDASPNNASPPKGGGGSFPGGTNNLMASLDFISAVDVKNHIITTLTQHKHKNTASICTVFKPLEGIIQVTIY